MVKRIVNVNYVHLKAVINLSSTIMSSSAVVSITACCARDRNSIPYRTQLVSGNSGPASNESPKQMTLESVPDRGGTVVMDIMMNSVVCE